MRWPLALLLVMGTLGTSDARGDDPPSPPPAGEPGAVRMESLDAFVAELRAIDQTDATTVQKIARRRKLGAARLVHHEGWISDIVPTVRDGRDTVSIEVRGLREPDPGASLVLAPEEAPSVEDWNKGDGVGWLERPIVGKDGEVAFEPAVSKLSDLLHVEVPRPDPDSSAADGAKKPVDDAKAPATKHPAAPGSSFKAWLQLLAESCRAGDWRRAWLVHRLADFPGRTWVFPAHVATSDAAGVVVAFDDLAPDWNEWPAEAARWGIGRTDGPDLDLTRRIEMPQRSGEMPAVGDAVDVAIDTAGFASLDRLQAASGIFPVVASLRRRTPETQAAKPAARPLTRPMGKPADYAVWIEKFATASHAGDVQAATSLWAEAAKKTWVFPAVIKSAADGRFEGRFCRDASFKGVLKRKEVDPLNGGSWVKTTEQPAGLWGFDPKRNYEFVVDDPEIAAALRVNVFVDVAIDLDPDGAKQAMSGPFPAGLSVWRLAGARVR